MIRLFSALLVLITFTSCKQKKAGDNGTVSNQDSINYLKKSVAFIGEVMPAEIKDSTFILADKSVSIDYFNCLDEVLSDTSTFSKEEIQSLKTERFHTIQRWTSESFPNIKLVNADTVESIFRDNAKGWDYFYKTIGREFHSFSYPIFIRNFKYCLFYNDNHCGWLCGNGRLTLYKYDNGKWSEVKSYCNWIS